ncbi:MAG TPA: aminotransferase class III-fold pyridoxal phosphate-dependent enzyme [Actinomycetota bacterium]|nr:aminotransferase class III-fold pyridoxal phosphate-dependent enzyme [Actinomycetota bacterium]
MRDPEATTGGSNVLEGVPPAFDASDAARLAADLFGIQGDLAPLGSERDQNFRIADDRGGAFVLKISNADEDPSVVDMENQTVLHVARTDPSLPVPRLVPTRDGDVTAWTTSTGGDGVDRRHLVRMITFLDGRHVEASELSDPALEAFGRTVARLGRAMRGFFHPAARRVLQWDVRHALDLRPLVGDIDDVARRALVERTLDAFEERVEPVFERLRAQVIHGDVTLDNAVVDEDGLVSGLLDFGDMSHTALVVDLSSLLEALMEREDPFDAGPHVVHGYRSVTPLDDEELELLPYLLAARCSTSVTMAAWRLVRFPENEDYIRNWEGAWPILEAIHELGFEEAARRLSEGPRRRGPRRGSTTEELRDRRAAVLGPALLPLTYERPVHVVRGEGVWLFDADGRRYLDCYNNVPVVGHAHPRVADAIARQSRLLNTNTRYLFDSVVELGERLLATMPDGIDTVSFVNSGSEANDLAWRLLTNATGGTGGIITDFAYHGITTAIAALSPEEWGAAGQPDHVERIPAPDGYRGMYRSDTDGWAERYASHVDDAVEALAARDIRLAATYIDGGFTSDGILAPPPAYLRDVVRRTHEAGGLFVADEVQAGYGRFGDGMWSFEVAGIEPDVVTLGKPMGNGFPVAAVCTRRGIAERMAETGSYFSTFGGNPVACAAALAVLDVIEEEQLQTRAREVGAYLRARLDELASRHPAIGDIRGRGLLIGVELVRDRAAREPDAEAADRVMNALRERGVLVGSTGRADDTLKIRPPLPFGREHADLLVSTLDDVLASLPR